MNTRSSSKSPFTRFEIYRVSSTEKRRHSDSPTSSILKTPTAFFVTNRSSSTKRLKFANGPVDLLSLKNSTNECSASVDSAIGTPESYKSNGNGEIITEESTIEVAVSPVKTMQVSPDSWKAFLEYKKYNDYANETEKTDYTYSRLSKFRHKEIIPGFLIRPNLSRASISSSRKSSLSQSGNQSSLNDSYLSYDFKVDSSPLTEFRFNEYKIPNSINKSSRSKYYLRSSDDSSTGEMDTKSHYLERDYFSDSAPEHIFKKTYQYTTGSSASDDGTRFGSHHLTTKMRSLDLDDTDIDEIDDNGAAYHGMNNRSNEWLERRKAASGIVSSSSPSTFALAGKSSNFISNFFATIFVYLTTVGSQSRNLFSRYILRRKDDSSIHEDMGYVSGIGGYGGSSWFGGKSYMSPYSNSVRYYGSQESWYQRFSSYVSDKFAKFSNLILGSKPRYSPYSSYAYRQQSERRWSLWWLLIPFLILSGFVLWKADEKYGVVSNQYKNLDCKANELYTAAENAVRPIWRTGYLTYKRAAASASCYVNDSWERLKLPFAHHADWSSTRLGPLVGGLVQIIRGIWITLWRGLWTNINFIRDALWNLCHFLIGVFGDLLSAVTNLLAYTGAFLRDSFLLVTGGLLSVADNFFNVLKSAVLNIGSYLYLLLFGVASKIPIESVRESTCHSQKAIDKLSSEMADFKSLSWDLSDMKKKIDQLELEFRKERESAKNKNAIFDKRLEANHLTLQKYQAAVNNALLAAKRPGQVSSSSVQYFLDNHSEELKQWILKNFVLKTDSPPVVDENRIAFLIAQYSNKSGEDLLNLKEEFKRFIVNHKTDLETLRRDVSTLATTSIQGGDVSVAYIKKLVDNAIKLYDADKTGRVDYALESAGGQVQSIRCTETYIASPKSYILLGWAVYTKTSSPRDAITPGMAAGQCWAFVGSQGFLVLQLSHTIEVTGFTMEHISRLLVPKGHIESAPRNFSMWGLKNEYDMEPYLFGDYIYQDNDETLQYFPVQYPSSEHYNMVELKITSNYGNPNYTCLYRIRVHGELRPVEP